MMQQMRVPHVVIVGGGFAGLWATRALRRAAVRVTLVDRRNYHLFQPLCARSRRRVFRRPTSPRRCVTSCAGSATSMCGSARRYRSMLLAHSRSRTARLEYDYLV
jgi:NADH dehydrogenase FAD-containing subunit